VTRNCFYSFHYKPDNWRASQVRNMGKLEGNVPVSDNAWEDVTKGGDPAIKKWIDDQMVGRSCAIILTGQNTAGRKWINYEIKSAWDSKKGVVCVYIHGLKDVTGNQGVQGSNPLDYVTSSDGKLLSSMAKAHDTPFLSSEYVYNHIKENIADWVEEAVTIRLKYP
jgi:hypothetical protein